ncbi:uncharacterized protein MYCFIDRAFT_211636 [Pseudocercospora fijiensis CIRAD86]|uniref:Uncharacterized protein n=1 Tax=Pseudocercospora fijiensis (strain CIRAD86) TaxID=383855 RepID=M3AD65_PSEFD|nr:uncharacterized protein MYCFIDRAFT_211636 [Pseudocercospora fijiensis CIRAD86]EME82491.1 hypothetical protein MYCFIDRAFT_211636 [Pseudocercospora fijiensis CIRAD86]
MRLGPSSDLLLGMVNSVRETSTPNLLAMQPFQTPATFDFDIVGGMDAITDRGEALIPSLDSMGRRDNGR